MLSSMPSYSPLGLRESKLRQLISDCVRQQMKDGNTRSAANIALRYLNAYPRELIHKGYS